MINTNTAEEFHLYPSCPKGGPQLATSPGSLLTMWNCSSTPDLMSQDMHFRKSSRWFWECWNLRSTVLQLWQMPPTSPKVIQLFKNFYLLAIIQLSEAACSTSSPSFPNKAIKSLTQQIFIVSPLCAKCLPGRKDVYVKITGLYLMAFSSPDSQCTQTIWLSDPFPVLLQFIQVVKVILFFFSDPHLFYLLFSYENRF